MTPAQCRPSGGWGNWLAATPRATGELKRGPVVPTGNRGNSPTLAALGVTKRKAPAQAAGHCRRPGTDAQVQAGPLSGDNNRGGPGRATASPRPATLSRPFLAGRKKDSERV